MSEQKNKLLEVKDLKVSFFTPAGEVKAVGGISYDLDYGEVMGVVGESGSGKSQEAYSIMGLLQSPGKVIGGSITFEGKDVLSFSKEEMTAFRGNKVAMIFQNPMTCLNPVYTIGNQLVEALRAHDKKISKEEAQKRAMEMMELVGINNVEKRMKQYPHEFSGGMRQRVMIAMGLIEKPMKLLYTDFSIIIGSVYLFLPLMIVTVAGVMENIDDDMMEAAQSLGASRTEAFMKVIFPMSLPGIIVGGILVFTGTLTAYTTPQLLGGNSNMVMATLIYQRAMSVSDWTGASVIALIMIVVTLVVIKGFNALAARLDRRGEDYA